MFFKKAHESPLLPWQSSFKLYNVHHNTDGQNQQLIGGLFPNLWGFIHLSWCALDLCYPYPPGTGFALTYGPKKVRVKTACVFLTQGPLYCTLHSSHGTPRRTQHRITLTNTFLYKSGFPGRVNLRMELDASGFEAKASKRKPSKPGKPQIHSHSLTKEAK